MGLLYKALPTPIKSPALLFNRSFASSIEFTSPVVITGMFTAFFIAAEASLKYPIFNIY
ncbi:MAG: hypothetical protein PT956_01265 [Firmicutes bacterium]|nr:hypothetical protein [Bacillota bacterium]